MEKIIDGNFAEILYNYKQSSNGSLTIDTIKKYSGKVSSSSETINKVGQITKYVDNGNVLKLRYNQYNKISEEIENDNKIFYYYTKQGKVAQSNFSNGAVIKFDYYNDGEIKKITSNVDGNNYMLTGDISKDRILETVKNINKKTEDSLTLAADSGVYVTYNINNNVGVTNFFTYYNVSAWAFNCYTFALGIYNDRKDPGNYSGRDLNLSSISGIKLNVEKDQESLGRSIYDSTVNASIPSHSWKIALRIRNGEDYHFMKISNESGASWQQKAGTGPVLQLLNGKTPSDITWDTYYYNSSTGKYAVQTSGFYNSSIKYMIIKD